MSNPKTETPETTVVVPNIVRRPSMMRETSQLAMDTVATGLKTGKSLLNTTAVVAETLEKTAEIIVIKLDEIKLEAWGDLQKTRAIVKADLLASGLTEEQIMESYRKYGFQ